MEDEQKQSLLPKPKESENGIVITPNRNQNGAHPASESWANYIQSFTLVFLTVQQTLQPLLVREAHRQAKTPLITSTMVLVTEVIRLFLCCMHLISRQCSCRNFTDELVRAFFHNKRETFKVCLPALIYVIQNNMYFFALRNLDATLFSITYQLRILTTALLTVVLLRRVFSLPQWGALFISLLGVICVQISSQQNAQHVDHPQHATDQLIGLITVLAMCWMSAFAGVFLEGVLKNSSCDIWLQNIRLSVITLPIAAMTCFRDYDVLQKNGFFHGWTALVWTISTSSAVGGVVVAAVLKYADNIKKSYCQSVALGSTAMLSIAIGDSQPSVLLFTGVALVIVSIFVYSLYPPKPQSKALVNELDESSSDSEDYIDEEKVITASPPGIDHVEKS